MLKGRFSKVSYQGRTYKFPFSALGGTPKEPRLKPADELLLNWAAEQFPRLGEEEVTVYHDRQGVLCTCVSAVKKHFVSNNLLHEERMLAASVRNEMPPPAAIGDLLGEDTKGTAANLLIVPKANDLFELYLRHVAACATPATKLACAFMTRNFSPKMLTIAAKYARTVSQSRAHKKARLLILEDFFCLTPPEISLNEVEFGGAVYQQYPGVFSAGHVDLATRFLLEEWGRNDALYFADAPRRILDVGCGNGIIGDRLLRRYPKAELTAYDVSRAAVASARLNFGRHGFADRATVLRASHMKQVPAPERFDLIVTNPPFHDGHKTDISVSIDLFHAASDRLAPGGHLVLVANRHLNYATHLRRYFDEVLTVTENERFVIYRSC